MAEWETLAADELTRLTAPNEAKKRATVLALVDARIAGQPEESVWGRPETCSRNIYHAKWKKDPIFASVLENVTALARTWHDGRALRALSRAAERLALASPVAVARAITLMDSGDEAVALRAAFGILDRAGVETAAKSKVDVKSVEMTHAEWVADQEKRHQQAQQALADFVDDSTDSSTDE